MTPKRAFTLIELLVVITTIAVLAALILSSLSAAKARARRTVCMNNLRQINLGLRMYSDESADKAPSPVDWTGYKNLMKSYVGINETNSSSSNKLFACPADVFFFDLGVHGRGYVPESLHDQAELDYTSYGFNSGLPTIQGTNTPGIAGQAMSAVKHPDRTVLVAEFPAFFPYSWHEPKRPFNKNALFNNAPNVLSFVDGHVSYTKIYFTTNTRKGSELSLNYDPPAGYDYQWTAD